MSTDRPSKREIFEALDLLISESLDLDPKAVGQTSSVDLGNFDSIDLLDAVSSVEDRFEIEFSRKELARIECREDLYNLVYRKAVVEREPIDHTRLTDVAVVIPVYNHAAGLGPVLEQAQLLKVPIFVVDDGSTDPSAEVAARFEGVTLLRHPENRGKGAALRTGLEAAGRVARLAVTIDADGQHEPLETTLLLAAIPPGSRAIVVGQREGMSEGHVPWTSRMGRSFSNFWVWLAGGPLLADTQSGFRLYPLPEALELGARCDRFQFEVESLVLAEWHRVPVVGAPVSVNYRPGKHRISHFRPLVDFLRNATLFTKLIALRWLVPRSIRTRKLRGRSTPPQC